MVHLRLAAVTVAFFIAGLLPAAGRQQAQPPTFRARVDLVTVDVSVTRRNAPVGGLSEKNFSVLDNGVRQRLEPMSMEEFAVSITGARERLQPARLPLEAWLVLDNSGSVESKLGQLVQAGTAFVDGLTASDRAGLVSFSQVVLVRQMLTPNLDLVRQALSAQYASGTTALYDATYVALRLRQPSRTRGVAVVLTDGRDNASWLSADRVVEISERSDMVVYGVAVSADARYGEFGPVTQREPPDTPQYQFLRRLAEASGGRVFSAGWNQLKSTFDQIMRDIRTRYLLTYYPTDAKPGWHRIEVRLEGASGAVTARRGYWVTGK